MLDVQIETDGREVGGARPRRAKPYRIEFMYRNPLNVGRKDFGDWTRYWSGYVTVAQRERALGVLNRKDRLFKYRASE